MSRVKQLVYDFLRKEDGPTAVECALMLALMIVVCVVAINTLQPNGAPTEGAVVVQSASD